MDTKWWKPNVVVTIVRLTRLLKIQSEEIPVDACDSVNHRAAAMIQRTVGTNL